VTAPAGVPHVEWATVPESGGGWVAGAARALEGLSNAPGTRAFVLEIPVSVGTDQAALHGLARQIRASGVVVIALLDGGYGADAATVMAAADLVVATARTTFVLAADSEAAFDEGWMGTLPIRAAKWLAFGAGALDAETLAAQGAINFVVPPQELTARGMAVAEHVARISEDVIALKKRAHDGRARFGHV
jgi:enoyl-CoA hydratase/carnithine racemase